jgi:uncharacterized protein (TIGR02145 family)
MRNLIFLTAFALLTGICRSQTVTDIDGNEYNTVTIGTQVWMAQNLATTKYNDSTSIPKVTDSKEWNIISTPAFCWYGNDSSTNKTIHGALYNWYVVNTKKLCPTGWHVPTNAEWITLANYLGGESAAGGKLKEKGTDHWNSPNTGASNSSGFNAFGSGSRFKNEEYLDMKNYGFWWSSTESAATSAWYRYLYNNDGSLHSYSDSKINGFSVRCLNDTYVTSISVLEKDDLLTYPNPVTSTLFIKSYLSLESIEIYDLNGVQKMKINKPVSQIDISSLANGMYITRISSNGNINYSKFIKK